LVFKSLREKLLKAKAKAHGMTVPELKRHLAKRKAENRKFKQELKRKEQEQKLKHEQWKIEQKYKQKRKAVKKGKRSGALGILEALGGSTSARGSDDPLGIFGSPTRKKKSKKRRKKR